MNPNERRYPPTLLLRYPHMFPRDIAIWERFLRQNQGRYDGFFYDTKVGTGMSDPTGLSPQYAAMARELSRFRIDAVGERGDVLEIFEVKPNASASAIGQVVTYTKLIAGELENLTNLEGAIVTDRELPDIRHLCEEMGINYYVV